MTDRDDTSKPNERGIANMLAQNPLVANPNQSEPASHHSPTNTKDASKESNHNSHKENGNFDNDDIQRKMNGVINNLQPDSPDHSRKAPTNHDSQRPKSPFVGQQAEPSRRVTSPQLSKDDKNILVVNQSSSSNNDHQKLKEKSRKNSSASLSSTNTIIGGHVSSSKKGHSGNKDHKQNSSEHDQKPNLSSSHKDHNTSDHQEPKSSHQAPGQKPSPTRQQEKPSNSHANTTNDTKHSRRSSTDNDEPRRKSSADKRPSQKHAEQKPKQNLHRSSSTDSEYEKHNSSSHHNKSDHSKNKQSSSPTKTIPMKDHQSTDDERASTHGKHIGGHNQASDTKKKANKDGPIHRSNSADSVNYIPIVDDKSLDSASGYNTEFEKQKRQRMKAKHKDVETNTDSKHAARDTSPDREQHKLQSKKASKGTKLTSDQHDRKTEHPSKQHGSDDNQNSHQPDGHRSKNQPADNDRHTQSDTEQIKTPKQQKRRRPKRISRTTQTHEFIFRRMEKEEHTELLPANETDKNIQTKQSQLRPRTKSTKKPYSVYLSNDVMKIQEVSPAKSSHDQRNPSKTSANGRNTSLQNGKLLILRPTLPFHHSNAVKVQHISLQYAIDLIPNDSKHDGSKGDQRSKSKTRKENEHGHRTPWVNPSASPLGNTERYKPRPKEKPSTDRNEERTYRRKNDGAI